MLGKNKEVGMPILGLLLISLGGLLLHLRIHPPARDVNNWVPLISCLVSVIAVPVLFCWRRTAVVAYLLTLVSVIVGAITMALFSIKNPPATVTLETVILQTTLADILILVARLPIAQTILGLHYAKTAAAPSAL